MSPDLRRRIVRILQRVCYSQTVLPRSCILSDISEGDIAFASGSFAGVWKGRYNGNPIRVKAFCADTQENIPRVKQVCSQYSQVRCKFRLTDVGSAYSRKLLSGGVSPTQTSCQCWASPQSRSPCTSSRNGCPMVTSWTSRRRTPRSTAFVSYADTFFILIPDSDSPAQSLQKWPVDYDTYIRWRSSTGTLSPYVLLGTLLTLADNPT